MKILSNAKFLSSLTYNNVKEYFNDRIPVLQDPLINNSVHWYGHATTIINLNGKIVLTDPVISDILGYFKRVVKKPFELKAEKIDYILLSHGHMDHIHFPSLRKLDKNATVIVPKGYEKSIKKLGYKSVITLRPGNEFKDDFIKIKCYEANHDGRRYYLGDDYESNSYLISSNGKSVFFAGDTAYTDNFNNISCDVALMPVGCYKPDRFSEMHCTPEEGYKMFKNMNATHMIPIHYKTFKLSLENFDETHNTLLELNTNNDIKIIDIGQTFIID
ncbi:MAG: MBL fold metallo-hydrolase [Clostridium sp.]